MMKLFSNLFEFLQKFEGLSTVLSSVIPTGNRFSSILRNKRERKWTFSSAPACCIFSVDRKEAEKSRKQQCNSVAHCQ